MANDEEAIKHTESDGWNREKTHRCDGFPVVSKKGEPPSGRIGISRRSTHPAGDRSLRDIKAEHVKLAMDARCSPGWILANHSEDQLSNLLGCLPSSNPIPDSGDQLPIRTKTNPVPPDHRFRRDEDESLFPSRPEPTDSNPKELVEDVEAWPRASPLEHGELLAEHEVLEDKIAAAAKQADKRAEPQERQVEHGLE